MSRLFLVNFLTPHEIFIWNLEAGKNNVTGIIKCFNDHTDFRVEDKPYYLNFYVAYLLN